MTGRPPRPTRLHDVGVVLILLGALTADSRVVAIPVAMVATGLVMVVASWGRWWSRQRRSKGVETGDRGVA